jgi:type I restriction enzyme, S subunit
VKAGWRIRPLGEVCTLINGRTYKKDELLEAGLYRVLRVGNFFTNEHWYYSDLQLEPNKYCESGDLLYAWSASFGPRIWDGGKVIYHYHIWKVAPRPDQVDQKFLFHFLDYDKDSIRAEHGAGATMIHVSKATMEKRSIPVPPIDEQKRIVAILDDAFEQLASARRNAEANAVDAREVFESYLAALFESPPKNWPRRALGSLCERITVGHVGPMSSRYVESGIPFLRSQNIRPFRVDLADVKFIDSSFMAELKKSELRPGDVAIVRTGYPGTCAVIPDSLELANCADLVIARPGPELSPHFLAMLLNSSYGKSHVAEVSVGAAQKHFNVGSARTAVFPIPPLAVQEELVEQAAAIRDMTTSIGDHYRSVQRELDCLRTSLLAKAFVGELATEKVEMNDAYRVA